MLCKEEIPILELCPICLKNKGLFKVATFKSKWCWACIQKGIEKGNLRVDVQ